MIELMEKFLIGEASPSVEKLLLQPENIEEWREFLIDRKTELEEELSRAKSERSKNRAEGFRTRDSAKWAAKDHMIMNRIESLGMTLRDMSHHLSKIKKIRMKDREQFFTNDKHLTSAVVLLETATMFVPKDMTRWFEQLDELKAQLGVATNDSRGNC